MHLHLCFPAFLFIFLFLFFCLVSVSSSSPLPSDLPLLPLPLFIPCYISPLALLAMYMLIPTELAVCSALLHTHSAAVFRSFTQQIHTIKFSDKSPF